MSIGKAKWSLSEAKWSLGKIRLSPNEVRLRQGKVKLQCSKVIQPAPRQRIETLRWCTRDCEVLQQVKGTQKLLSRKSSTKEGFPKGDSTRLAHLSQRDLLRGSGKQIYGRGIQNTQCLWGMRYRERWSVHCCSAQSWRSRQSQHGSPLYSGHVATLMDPGQHRYGALRACSLHSQGMASTRKAMM